MVSLVTVWATKKVFLAPYMTNYHQQLPSYCNNLSFMNSYREFEELKEEHTFSGGFFFFIADVVAAVTKAK